MTLTVLKIHSQHYELRDPSRDGGDGKALIVARVYEPELVDVFVAAAALSVPDYVTRSRARNQVLAASAGCSVPDGVKVETDA